MAKTSDELPVRSAKGKKTDASPQTEVERQQDAELEADFEQETRPDRNEALSLRTRLHENAPASPELSGGDVDAAWEQGDSGEETVGGSAPTPDQDRVDEIGAAVGVTYDDAEPLHDKLAERDHKRWELDPRSADDAK